MGRPLIFPAAALLMSGCLAPFHAFVPESALAAELDWTTVECPDTPPGGAESCTDQRHEVDYLFQATGPPYSAVLQVISLRDLGRRTTQELLDLVEAAVADSMEQKGIRPDERPPARGERELASGLRTQYFVRNGTVESASTLFRDSARVRIIGEVGYDGRSSTMILAIGIAQTEAQQCTGPPILPSCQTRRDVRSWVHMVGDPAGTIDGAVSRHGLLHNLVTHD